MEYKDFFFQQKTLKKIIFSLVGAGRCIGERGVCVCVCVCACVCFFVWVCEGVSDY